MSMRLIVLTFLVLLISMVSVGQPRPGDQLDFKVKGWKDTTIYLGYFQGDQTFVKDTASVNAQGDFSFEGSKPLLQGVYILVLDKARMIDFVVSEDQRFMLEADKDDMIRSMKVT